MTCPDNARIWYTNELEEKNERNSYPYSISITHGTVARIISLVLRFVTDELIFHCL